MPRDANTLVASTIVGELARHGVRHACVSPGSRSTPLVFALAREEAVAKHVLLDERGAAFFALGLARATRTPVVLVCTSGTAAANYHPAVVEASQSRVPLLVLTADRPPELRECAAPQTIDQIGLYGSAARWFVDVPLPGDGGPGESWYARLAARLVDEATGPRPGPVHANFPFREPLVADDPAYSGATQRSRDCACRISHAILEPEPATIAGLAEALEDVDEGLIVAGPDAEGGQAGALFELARRLGWPLVADPLSGLRWSGAEVSGVIDTGDLVFRSGSVRRALAPRAVLSFGMPPTSKALSRALADAGTNVIVAPPGEWPDPNEAATRVVRGATEAVARALAARLPKSRPPTDWSARWAEAQRAGRAALDAALDAEGFTEALVARELFRSLEDGAAVVVGNSMPIRDVDLFAAAAPKRVSVFGNRGANGIDGMLATGLGTAVGLGRPTAVLLGDLSFLHDLSSIAIAARVDVPVTAVVVNNDGGGIFSRLPPARHRDVFERYFGTPHGLDLAPAVTMARGAHRAAADASELAAALDEARGAKGFHVVEARTDRATNLDRQTRLIERALEQLEGALGTNF